jgi:putative DNA primase/helicase
MNTHTVRDTVTVSNLEINIHSAQDTLSVSNRELFRNNVTQEWLKSGVTQEYIDFLFEHYQFDSTGLFICDAQEACQLLQMDYPLDHQEYYWGFKDVNGNIQIKVNIPNGAKYLCPRNNGSDAFRLPIPDYFEGELLKTTIEDFETVAIIEGIKKAASLISNGKNKIYPIAIIGVHCALPNPKKSQAKQRHFLKEFLSTAVELDKDCLIIFDKDWQTNEQVGKALIKTHLTYLTMGLDTYTPIWKTDHKGIDDYLGSLKPNMRREAIIGFVDNPGDSLTFEQVREQLEKIYTQKPVKNSKLKTAQDICSAIIAEYQDDWKYSLSHNSWFQWNGKYWEQQPKMVIASNVQLLLEARNIRFGTSSKIDDIVKQMSRKLLVREWLINQKRDKNGNLLPPRYINLLNGIYDMQERKLRPHCKSSMFLSVVNREYSPLETTGSVLTDLEKYAPTWYKSYLDIMNGNKTKLLKLVAAINGVLTHRLSYHHKFITLIGSPGSGKSSFARLLNRMVGDDNTTFTSLKKLSSEYTIASLINSQLVVCDDEEKQTDFEYLRKLTGSGKVEYRQIYGKPSAAEFLGSVLVNAVHNPFAGDIAGLERRIFLLKFDGRFKHRDTAVEDYIWEHELEPLMAIALSMPEVEVDGYLLEKFQYSDSNSLNDKWMAVCDSEAIASWMDLNLIQGSPDDFLPIGEFFESFCNYCDDNKFNKLNSNTFSRRLSEYLDILGWKHSKKQMRYRGKKVRGVSGIKLRVIDQGGYVPAEDIPPTITEILTASQSASVQSVHSPPIPVSDSVSDVPIPEQTIDTSLVQPSTSSVHHPELVERDRNLDQASVPMDSESVPMDSEISVQPEPTHSKDCIDSTDSTDSKPTPQKMFDRVMTDDAAWEKWESANGSYPNPKSNNVKSSKKLCKKVIEQLINCTTREDVERLEASPNYQRQLVWVREIAKMFDYSEYHHYLECLKRSQQSLF